jgi:RraA family protein
MYKAIRKNPSAPQAPDDFLSALRDIPVSALSDNMHRNIGSVGLRPYQRPGRKTMAGTAITVRSRGGDNLTYLRALEFCRKGDVLVVDAGGDLDNAVVGGILSFYAAHVGMAGLVVDGAIRDVAEIRERDFPVYARGVTHRGPYKDGPGEINVTVSAGGMVVKPGDIVVGDQDGWRRGLPAPETTVSSVLSCSFVGLIIFIRSRVFGATKGCDLCCRSTGTDTFKHSGRSPYARAGERRRNCTAFRASVPGALVTRLAQRVSNVARDGNGLGVASLYTGAPGDNRLGPDRDTFPEKAAARSDMCRVVWIAALDVVPHVEIDGEQGRLSAALDDEPDGVQRPTAQLSVQNAIQDLVADDG